MLICKCGANAKMLNHITDDKGVLEVYKCLECGKKGTLETLFNQRIIKGCLKEV